jgi:hypothetical protein
VHPVVYPTQPLLKPTRGPHGLVRPACHTHTERDRERGSPPSLGRRKTEGVARLAAPVGRGGAGSEGGADEGRGVEAHPRAVVAWREVAHGLLAACAVTRRGTAPMATALPRFQRLVAALAASGGARASHGYHALAKGRGSA